MLKEHNTDLDKIFMKSLKLIILLLITLVSCEGNEQSEENLVTSRDCEKISRSLKKCKLYRDEILISEGLYFREKQINTHTYYDKDGNIISEKEFIFIDTIKNILNQEIYFDKNQDTLKDKSFYYNISEFSDSIVNGDSIVLDFSVHIPIKKTSNYTLEIQLDNPENINEMLVFVSDKLKRRIVLKSGTIGEKNIQGIILVGEFLKSDFKEDENPLSVKKFYFDLSYVVH
jgi:hypothetical protein